MQINDGFPLQRASDAGDDVIMVYSEKASYGYLMNYL